MRNGVLLCAALGFFLMLPIAAVAAEEPPASPPPSPPAAAEKEWAVLESPAEGTQVIGKKPVIKVAFAQPITPGTLLVTLDSTDITQMLTATEAGFTYEPLGVMPPGSHTLTIAASGAGGAKLQKTAAFTTRQTAAFEEAYAKNDLSAVYEATLRKPTTATTVPHNSIESILGSEAKIRDKEFEVKFNSRLRYFDEDVPLAQPLKKGFDAQSWTLTSSYTGEGKKGVLTLGDVQVTESPYTITGLSRKGGVVNGEYGNFFVNAFNVQSAQYPSVHGVGISDDPDGHITGVSGGTRLFDRRLEFKTLYVNGSEPASSFGTSAGGGVKKGDVLGFVLKSDFFQNKLQTDFETDFSKFDTDTSDEFSAKRDKAYKLKAAGVLGTYNYEALWEYIGKDYQVVGNPGLQKDKEGGALRGGTTLGNHVMNLALSRYNDNVRDDPLFSRIVSYLGTGDYTFKGIPNLPLGLSYQKGLQHSERVADGQQVVKLYTDTVTGRANYTRGAFGIGAQTSYALIDDKGPTGNDSRAITYTLTPTYTTPMITASSNLQLNQAKAGATGSWTDTYTAGLNLKTKFLEDRLFFDFNGTYNVIKAQNESTDSKNLTTDFRVAYAIKGLFRDLVKPSIALRGTYVKTVDRVNPSAGKNEFSLFLTLSTAVPFSL